MSADRPISTPGIANIAASFFPGSVFNIGPRYLGNTTYTAIWDMKTGAITRLGHIEKDNLMPYDTGLWLNEGGCIPQCIFSADLKDSHLRFEAGSFIIHQSQGCAILEGGKRRQGSCGVDSTVTN